MFQGDYTRSVRTAHSVAPKLRHGHAFVPLILTAALIVAIAAAGTAASVGFARAQTVSGMPQPDTSLVIGMLAGAVAVMSILSALAVRFIGRPRQR